MDKKKKLWLMVLLQGIAETDTKYVSGKAKDKEKISRQAQEWRASAEFDDVCELAGVPPEAARRLSPREAWQVLYFIEHGKLPNEPKGDDDVKRAEADGAGAAELLGEIETDHN